MYEVSDFTLRRSLLLRWLAAATHARAVSQVTRKSFINGAGLPRPGFECAECKAALPLFLVAVGKLEQDALPDPFLAKCPFCGHTAAYPKSSIRQMDSLEHR